MSARGHGWAAACLAVSTVAAVSAWPASAAVPADGSASLRPLYAAAVTFTVDNRSRACTDDGPGTSAQPFCSIGAAVKMAVAGDTVRVTAGTYRGTEIDPRHSGTRARPIRFLARRGVRITGGEHAFVLVNRRSIVISGFTITKTSSYGIEVSGGSNIVISRNTVSFSGRPVRGRAAAGIYVRNLHGGQVSFNSSHDNSSHGIYLLGTTTGVIVRRNRAYRNAYQYQRNANGIDDTAPGNTIVHNRTYSNEDSGINIFPGANRTIVSGNVSYHNGDHGIDNLDVTGGRVIGNTVFRNCTSGINIEGRSGNYVVENNIAVNNSTGAIVNPTPINPPHAYVNNCDRRNGNIGIYDSATESTTANFNLVWQSGSGTEYVWDGIGYSSRAALAAATEQETRGIFANPMFANPAAWNLRLTGHSPAIDSANSGVRGEQRRDVTGRRRVDDHHVANTGAGPRRYDDRGAFEFRP
jgi:Right handed beta helix region